MEEVGNIIKGFPVQQNGQDFIIGKITIGEVLRYTCYTERVIVGFDEEEKPIYNNHVQRKVEMSRVNKIADYLIEDEEATFPTNIVLGIPMSVILSQRNDEHGYVEVLLDARVAEEVKRAKQGNRDADIFITIIDGQHRIKGIEVAIERLEKQLQKKDDEIIRNKLNDLLNIELVVSFFIDKSLEYQAMIFSTINRTQKRVSQDLVYSLFGLSQDDTPYKTALEVVLALNGHPKSPFYRRIKLYGKDYDKLSSPPLSQATMIKSIVALISESLRESENDKYRKRRDLKTQKGNKFLPFRSFYANNEDTMISDCLFYFFNTVKDMLGKYWNYDGVSKPQNILQSTVGYQALLDLMVEIIRNENITVFNSNTFSSQIKQLMDIPFGDIKRFPMSNTGKIILSLSMSLAIYPASDNKDDRLVRLLELESNKDVS